MVERSTRRPVKWRYLITTASPTTSASGSRVWRGVRPTYLGQSMWSIGRGRAARYSALASSSSNGRHRRWPDTALRYIGFDGSGKQVRDADASNPCLRPWWMSRCARNAPAVSESISSGAGADNARSLAQLTRWCNARFGSRAPQSDPPTADL